MLAKRFPRLDDDERLAVYHESWARVYVKRERGEEIRSLRAFLLATASGEALHALSRGKPPMPLGPDDPRLATLADERQSVEDEVVSRDQARIARNLLDTLDERQRDVLKLRWDLQLSGEEIRAALNLSRRQYQRLVEEGAVAVAERVRELERGDWSRRQRSLLAACLVEVPDSDGGRRSGIASSVQRERAQRMLESDPHVAALYMEVRAALRRATALLPLPALVPREADTPLLASFAERLSDARDQCASLLGSAKQQATGLYLRAADPALLAGGPRPGSAVIAVAGLLAVGSGAYGVHEATAPSDRTAVSEPSTATTQPSAQIASLADSFEVSPPAPQKPRPKRPKPNPSAPQPNDQPSTTPTPTTPAQPAPTPRAPSTNPTEFGFED